MTVNDVKDKYNNGIKVPQLKKDFDKLLENISDLYTPEELEQIRIAYQEMKSSGKAKAKLIRPVVPIREWINSSYYVGPDVENVYNFWKQKVIDIFERPKEERINQVVFTGAIGCLKTDTLYATSEGFKTIKQLSKYNEFSVLSESSIENAKASEVHILGIKPTKKVWLYNGTVLEGTYNHKIKVLEDNKIIWKRFDQLAIGDNVIHQHKKEQFGSKDYDPELAYMIGLLLGDGYMYEVKRANNKKSGFISLALQSNQNNYQYIIDLFTKYYSKPSITYGANKNVSLRKQSADFINLPYWPAINNLAYTKYIPEYLLEMKDYVIAALLRGIFDTDSGINERSANIELTLANKSLIYQIKRLLAAFGINSRVTEKKTIRALAYRLVISGKENLQLYNKYIGFMIDYKQSTLEAIIVKDNSNQRSTLPGVLEVLQRHNNNLHLVSSREHKHATDILKSSCKNKYVTARTFNYFKEHFSDWLDKHPALKYIKDNNAYTVKVTSIEDSSAEVGDIEVPTTHKYNLGGLISHNTGKTTAASLIIIRIIYELSCYENISALFNLFGVSRIAFAYLSVTREQAQNTGFALLVEWLDSIPYFRETFKRNSRIDSILMWPQERLMVTFGSVANHFIGMNLIGSILDEANFFSGRSKEESDYRMNSKVADLYTQIVTRSESRFIVNGVNYSMSILVSSSTVESSFTEERIEAAKDDIHTYIVSPALWDVKPQNYSGKKFFVYVGGDSVDPFVIKDITDFNMLLQNKKLRLLDTSIPLEEAYSLLPVTIQSRLIKVPVEHKKSFQGDIIIALQDLAGYSVSSANKLFTSNVAYNKCLDSSLYHPFSKQELTVSTTQEPLQEGYMPVKSYLLNNIEFPNKHMPRYMHLDLALTGDSLGISMCYISNWKSIYKLESNYEKLDESSYNGQIEDEIKLPIISYDFMLRVNPPKKPNRISLSKIRDFIVYLRNVKGIKFGLITADQFQSEQLLQELAELGFNTGRLSVDRTPDAYLSFTNLLYEDRVRIYDYEPFKQELFGVVYYPAKKKVDHTATGSKDISDSVVGSAYNAIKSEDKSDITELSLTQLFADSNISEPSSQDAINQVLSALTDMLKRG